MSLITSIASARSIAAGAAFLVAMGLSSVASAVSFEGSFRVDAHEQGDGLMVKTAKLFDPIDFELATVGEKKSYNLFKIWTDETSVNADDFAPQDISVNFDFSSPAGTGAVEGETFGASYLFGLFQGGEVEWHGPELITFDDGTQLRITLSGDSFNWGMFGTSPGKWNSAIIAAEFELISDSTAVIPLPAGLPLLLSGMGGLAFLRWRRNAAAA